MILNHIGWYWMEWTDFGNLSETFRGTCPVGIRMVLGILFGILSQDWQWARTSIIVDTFVSHQLR